MLDIWHGTQFGQKMFQPLLPWILTCDLMVLTAKTIMIKQEEHCWKGASVKQTDIIKKIRQIGRAII